MPLFAATRRSRSVPKASRRLTLGLAAGRVVESLEGRVLFSSTLATGAASVGRTLPYTLSLNVPPQAGASWSIDWGDNSTSTAAGTASSATHTYAVGQATRTITATVTGLTNPLDTSFGPGHTGKVTTDLGSTSDYGYRTLVQPNGKILLAGGANFSVVRYNKDGTPDVTFGANGIATQTGTDVAYGAALLPDGRVLVGGGSNFGLCQLNPDGSLDQTFGGGTGKSVSGFGTTYVGYDLALLPSGKILMAGKNGNDFVVARFNADGSVDKSFGTSGKTTTDFAGSYDKGYALAVTPDGASFFVGGQSRDSSGNYNGSIAKYSASTGKLDTSFGSGGKVTTDFGNADDAVWAVAVLPSGQLLAAGRGGTSSTGYDFAVARYNANGSLDTSFGGNGTGYRLTDFGHGGDQAYGMSVLSTGKVLLVGRAESSSDALDFALARYNADGTLDATFGTGGKVTTDFAGSSDYGETVAVQPDGDVIVAGASSTVGSNGATDVALARYTMTGDGGSATGTPVVAVLGPPEIDGRVTANGAGVPVTAHVDADDHYGLYYSAADGSGLDYVGRNEFDPTGSVGPFGWSDAETYNSPCRPAGTPTWSPGTGSAARA